MSKHLTRKTPNELATAELTHSRFRSDEDLSRITQWVFQPGDQTSWNRHEYDYVTEQQLSGVQSPQGANGSEKRSTTKMGLPCLVLPRSNTTRPVSRMSGPAIWK